MKIKVAWNSFCNQLNKEQLLEAKTIFAIVGFITAVIFVIGVGAVIIGEDNIIMLLARPFVDWR